VIALETAGGPLYDTGPYVILPVLLTLYHHPANQKSEPENVHGSMLTARTGVDLTTTISMTFPKLGAMAVLTASFAYSSPKDELCVIIGIEGYARGF